MARSISVSKLLYDYTTWEADALVIKLNKMKNDQEGNNAQDRRVYANPMNPSICAILSFGLLLVCRKNNDDGKNFPGDCMDKKFGKWMRSLLNKIYKWLESRKSSRKIYKTGRWRWRSVCWTCSLWSANHGG